MRTVDDLIRFSREKNVQMVDLRFVDLFGAWHHVTIPAQRLEARVLTEGVPFDGSSIPGFKRVAGGDMVLVPDPTTARDDPFWGQKTLAMICSVHEAGTLVPFARDPRTVAV